MGTTVEERRARKAEMWFDKPGLADLDDDSDVEGEEVTRAMKVVEMKGGKIRKKQEKLKIKKDQEESGYTSGSDDDEAEESNEVKENQPAESKEDTDSDSDSEDEEKEFEVVPQAKGKKRSALSYEELALGEKLIHSKKSRRDIMEGGWNRFMFDDTGLPDWFVKKEEMHMRKRLDVDPETVEKYKNRDKEINVKTIKKVVEAKARRKRRVAKKMDRAKKKATQLLDNEDIGSREKAAAINKMYKKAAQDGKKKEVSYVVARKHAAAKRTKRPTGVKGPYKQVDPRMKKDTQGKRGNATAKKGKKRRLKGKQAKPTKQFNTNR